MWPHGRRLEVVADGFPLCSGAQLAINTLLCAPSVEMATRRATPRRNMVLHSGELANGKKRALNCWAVELAPGWSFLQLRWREMV